MNNLLFILSLGQLYTRPKLWENLILLYAKKQRWRPASVSGQSDQCLCHSHGLGLSYNWAVTCDFQQCGMCNQQSLRSACTYVQSEQSLCQSLAYSMSVNLQTEHHLESLTFKGGYTVMRLFLVYTCQSATLLEITCHGSIIIFF